jgi:hypothetical protein
MDWSKSSVKSPEFIRINGRSCTSDREYVYYVYVTGNGCNQT